MNTKKVLLYIIIMFCLSSSLVWGSDKHPITQDNWINHPEIVEIRKIYNEIEKAIEGHLLDKQERSLDDDYPGPVYKGIFFDDAKTARKYMIQGGSEDSFLTECYYYDTNQNLRFVFIKGGAVCGSVMEHRIYYDPNGARIWEVQKYLQGPDGYWPDVWPEDALIFDPWLDFDI